jgi:hypothetical protein
MENVFSNQRDFLIKLVFQTQTGLVAISRNVISAVKHLLYFSQC